MGIPGVVVGELRGDLEAGGAEEEEYLSFCPVPADCSVNQRDGGRLTCVSTRFLRPYKEFIVCPSASTMSPPPPQQHLSCPSQIPL